MKAKIKIRLIGLLVLMLSFQALGEIIKGKEFSYSPPPHWNIASYPGMEYPIARGPREHGFPPSINVVSESFAGPLEQYLAVKIRDMRKLEGAFKDLGRSPFKTSSGLAGVKLKTEMKEVGKLVDQNFYVFGGKGNEKFFITCSAAIEDKAVMDPLFDQSVSTFTLRR